MSYIVAEQHPAKLDIRLIADKGFLVVVVVLLLVA